MAVKKNDLMNKGLRQAIKNRKDSHLISNVRKNDLMNKGLRGYFL